MNKVLSVALMLVIFACSNTKPVINAQIMATEPFIIYKTKADYSNLVPVILNAEKTAIVSYPAPSDVLRAGELALPLPLIKGYLIDVRGIGPHVAFTSYTYSTYSQLDQAPSIEQLFKSIVDNDPLVEMYNCSEFIQDKYNMKKANKLVKSGFKACLKIR